MAARTWRDGQTAALRRHYLEWQAYDSEHFHIRFSEHDSNLIPWLAQEADRAAEEVAILLPHHLQDNPWLVVVPDRETMQKAFGWGDSTGALGVYMVDTIKVLSPLAWDWLREEKRLKHFQAEGPLAHEYTHYVLDLRTGGNYPYWFSEGLAQLVEYKLNGYEWLEADSSLGSTVYTLSELERKFSGLDRQALAYRQSLSIVTYLESLQGMEGINALLDDLGRGHSFYQALHGLFGLDRESLGAEWQQWYRQDGRWFLTASRK